MSLLKRFLGIEDIQSKLISIEKNNNENISKIVKENRLVIKKIERKINDYKKVSNQQKNESKKIESELIKISKLLSPKQTNLSNFNIIDTISNESLFCFNTLSKEETKSLSKKKLSNNPNKILQLIGSIPELVSGGLLSKTYRFKYPKDAVGKIMKIGSGQGTAVTSNGKILSHGTYIANTLISIPIIAFSVVNIVIKQHYLAKINENLEKINKNLEALLDFEFIKKESKIEAIIKFYKQAFSHYEIISENKNYKNAILSNIITKNIEVYELIHFYKNSIGKLEKDDQNNFQKSTQYLLSLQELFVFGKILEFKYADEFNEAIIENLKYEFNEMQNEYIDFYRLNEGELHNLQNTIDLKFYDKWYFLRKKQRKNKINKSKNIKSNRNFVNELRKTNEIVFNENEKLLDELLINIRKPQDFLIENGELYQIE